MAKSKTALGNKINFVHDAITQKRLGEETSQIGFEKMFKPLTAKLGDVMGPPNLPQPRRKKANLEGIDYFPEMYDPFEDMEVDGLFDEEILPKPDKQIPAAAPEAPPNYEDVLEEIEQSTPDYSLEPKDVAEEEEEDDGVDVEVGDVNSLLNKLKLTNYQKIDNALEQSTASEEKKKKYLVAQIKEANQRRSQQYNRKSYLKKQVQSGKLTADEIAGELQQIYVNNKVLNDYMKYYKSKIKSFKGSGLRPLTSFAGVRQRGRGISFFSNPKELLRRLEVIVGSILAGNTNVSIRNTGVGILDLLLKEGAINQAQHEKLFRKYFKP